MKTSRKFEGLEEQAKSYFMFGQDYVKAAEPIIKRFLDERDHNYSFCLLLVTGLELIFKSFLLFYRKPMHKNILCFKFEVNKTNDKYLKKLGHNYLRAYKECAKIDKTIFSDEILRKTIKDLYEKFPNSMQCRYSLALIRANLNISTFIELREKLIEPLKEKYKKDFNFTLS